MSYSVAVMPQQNRLKLPSASAKKQAEGRLVWNEARSMNEADFYTVGYTGRPLGEIVNALVQAGVRTLVDIRQNAVSMYRPELSKNNLRRFVEAQSLEYVHAPDLGVPRDIRAKAIETGSRDVIWSWYDEHVAAHYASRNLHHFFNSMEHPVAFLCTELDPHECHRHRLCVALEANGLRGFDL